MQYSLRRSRRFLPLLGAAVMCWLCAPPASACDSTACMLVTRGRGDLVPRHRLRMDLSVRYTDQALAWSGDHSTATVLRPRVDFERQRLIPDYHGEQGGRESFLQADAAYGLSHRATVMMSVPLLAYRNYDMIHSQFAHVYTTHGMGDMVLAGRVALDAEGQVIVGAGLKLPTGPFRRVSAFDHGIHDPTLQPGSGSWDGNGSLRLTRRMASIDWTALGSYQVNTTNDLGYRFGNDRILALTAGRSFGRLGASLQAKSFHSGRSHYLGQPVPATGETIAYLIPGISTSLHNAVSPYVFAQLPVHRHVNESQLAPRVGVLVGVTKMF